MRCGTQSKLDPYPLFFHVFPKCSGHVHLYFGRYLLDCRCDELWDVCTLGGPWMLSPRVSMSTVSTVSTVSTAQDALHELPESHPTLPTSPGAAGGESQGAAGEAGDVSHHASALSSARRTGHILWILWGTDCGVSAAVAYPADPASTSNRWKMLEHVGTLGIGHEFITVKLEPWGASRIVVFSCSTSPRVCWSSPCSITSQQLVNIRQPQFVGSSLSTFGLVSLFLKLFIKLKLWLNAWRRSSGAWKTQVDRHRSTTCFLMFLAGFSESASAAHWAHWAHWAHCQCYRTKTLFKQQSKMSKHRSAMSTTSCKLCFGNSSFVWEPSNLANLCARSAVEACIWYSVATILEDRCCDSCKTIAGWSSRVVFMVSSNLF